MVERSEGKLHPLIEFLIIAGIILVCSLCSSFFMSKMITQKSYAETEGIINIFSWLNMIFPFVASFVCIKLIEHRNINIFKLFTIVLCIMLFCNYIHLITLNYIGARFGVAYLAKLTSANSFVKPFVTAFLITLFIYIFDLPKADAYVFPVPVAEISNALSSPVAIIFFKLVINPTCILFGCNLYFSSEVISSCFAISC